MNDEKKTQAQLIGELNELRQRVRELEAVKQVELADARDRYVDLFDFAPIGYFVLGEKDLIQEVNLSGATLLGMGRHSLLNQPLTRFIVPEDQNLFYQHQRQAFSTQTRRMCELRMQKENGAPFYAQLESVVASDSRYYHNALRIAVIDITEREQREQELRESKERYRKLFDLCG